MRQKCLGPYVRFEPAASALSRALQAVRSPELPALEAEYFAAEGTDGPVNTLQWSTESGRQQVIVDAWLGFPGNPGFATERAKTPLPFVNAYDALVELQPEGSTAPTYRLASSFDSGANQTRLNLPSRLCRTVGRNLGRLHRRESRSCRSNCQGEPLTRQSPGFTSGTRRVKSSKSKGSCSIPPECVRFCRATPGDCARLDQRAAVCLLWIDGDLATLSPGLKTPGAAVMGWSSRWVVDSAATASTC